MEAAAHCDFEVRSFIKWLRRGLLPTADEANGLWEQAAIDSALKTLMEIGYRPSADRNFKPREYSFPNVHRVPRSRSDGTRGMHFYFRPKLGGLSRIKMPGVPGSPVFMRALIDCERQLSAQNQAKSIAAPSIVAEPPAESLRQPKPNSLDASRSIEASRILRDSNAQIFLTPEELSLRYRGKIATETLANWRAAKVGPPFFRIGKAVFYRTDLVKRWESQRLILCDLSKMKLD